MSAIRWQGCGARRVRAWLAPAAIAGLLVGASLSTRAAASDTACKGPDLWPTNPDRLAREIATACNALVIRGSADPNQLSEAYNMLSICLGILGLNKGRLDLSSKAIEKRPGDAVLYDNRGRVYFGDDALEPALADAKTAMRLNSSLVRPLLLAGRVKARSGDEDAALSYFRQAITVNKDHPESYMELGRFNIARGRPRQALDDFVRSEYLIQKDAFGTEAHNWTLDFRAKAMEGRCRALAMLAEASAGAVCDRALGERPASANANLGKGLIDLANRDDETALKHFNGAVRSDPYLSEAIVARGKVYESRGDLERARQEYDRAIERQPKQAWGYLARGELFEKEGQGAKAEQALAKAIEVQPRLPQAHSVMAAYYERKNETIEAVEQYKRALELDPGNQEAKSGLARLRNRTD
ncbi:tetratricopeptide repeat protein [Methylobacterium sp. SI9]|uniref:tetratricopeptide repeat protein n=1 Tax=Methylobacterium guangdongense TaxID=3138811 RepID=UPI00313AC202